MVLVELDSFFRKEFKNAKFHKLYNNATMNLLGTYSEPPEISALNCVHHDSIMSKTCILVLRVEFLLKTDSGYPKDTGV